MKETWQIDFEQAVNEAEMSILGVEDANSANIAHLCTVLIEAYGGNREAFLLIKPSIPKSDLPSPAALLYHPDTSFIVFQMNDLSVDDLERGPTGELYRRHQSAATEVDLLKSLNDLTIDVEGAVKKQLNHRENASCVHGVLVLPHITLKEWATNDMVDELSDRGVFLSDDISTHGSIQNRIEHLLEHITNLPTPGAKQLAKIRRAFGDNAVINEKQERRSRDVPEWALGRYLDELATMEKKLSDEQQQLSLVQVDGSPRLVRGVAGSGKTVVLANMVARFMTRQLDMFESNNNRVAVICFNRSLVPMLRRKLQAAYTEKTQENSLPDSVYVKHFNGLFFELRQEWLRYIPIGEGTAEQRAERYLAQVEELKRDQPERYERLLFDAVFVDEGQDLSPQEYELLMALTRTNSKTGEKSFVIFYDDAQNLYAKTRPNWKRIGLNVSHGRSHVMRVCFRNTNPVVETAFNVLLGTKSDNKTVATRTFADVAYLKQVDLIEETSDHVNVKFTQRRGPAPFIKEFSSRDQEVDWVAGEVVRLVAQEMVRPEDILILFNRSGEYRDLARRIQTYDKDRLIRGFIQPYKNGNRDDQDRYIFEPGYLTISTIHGAKGYDAMVVFLVGVDQFDDEPKDRAIFYVGATRSKLALYLTGTHQDNSLLQEAAANLNIRVPVKSASEAVL
jgi:superfamily I DNA and RNA helicase